MIEDERRKYPRVDASNAITYCCLDENDNEFDQCMARAIAVSPVGITIETFQHIESEMVRLISVDPDENLIDIRGRIIHSSLNEDGRNVVGVCLEGSELENTRFVLKLLAVCQETEIELVTVKRSGGDDRNRRKFPRISTCSLVSYSFLDQDGIELGSGIAMALDINPLGTRIQTYQEILSDNIYLTSLDADEEIIGVPGRIAHAQIFDDGGYECGIQFLGTQDENTDFALKLLSAFQQEELALVMEKTIR